MYGSVPRYAAAESDNKVVKVAAALAVAGCVALGAAAFTTPAATTLYAPAATTVRPAVQSMMAPAAQQMAQTRYQPAYAAADYQEAEVAQYEQYAQLPAQVCNPRGITAPVWNSCERVSFGGFRSGGQGFCCAGAFVLSYAVRYKAVAGDLLLLLVCVVSSFRSNFRTSSAAHSSPTG